MTISSINSIFLSYWCKRGFIYVWVEALCPMLDERELSQQSIVKTTHFFSFTELFGRNTQFSVCLRNTLLFKWLRWFLVILHSEFDLTHCRWACFALRNMPDRKTIPSQRWLGLASFATRYMPNGTRTSHFWRYDGAKCYFRCLSRAKFQHNFLTKKLDEWNPSQLSWPTSPPCARWGYTRRGRAVWWAFGLAGCRARYRWVCRW